MKKRTGGEAIVDTLIANGIDQVFGLPGVQLDPIFAAFYDRQDKIKVVHSRHEQGCTYMAYGYAQSTGKTGVSFVVPGPGLLNAGAAIVTAYACNTPLLCIAGQLRSQQIGKGHGFLHEIPDQLATAKGLVKWGEHIGHPNEATEKVNRALTESHQGRKRPSYLEAPLDILQMDYPCPEPCPAPDTKAKTTPDKSLIGMLAQQLANAECPVIFAGGGAIDAGPEISLLSEKLNCPVVMSANGLGTLDSRSPRAFTPMSGFDWWSKADTIVLLGTRLTPGLLNWNLTSDQCLVKVDIDPEELTRCPKPLTQALVGDVAATCAELLRALEEQTLPPHPERTQEIQEMRASMERELAPVAPQHELLGVIREQLGEDGILVSDLTQLFYTAQDCYPVYKPRTFIQPSYQGTLGHCVATSIGVKVGNPDKRVLSLAGDGGFMFTVQELITAVQYNVPTVFLVMNDNAFGNVKRILNQSYGGRTLCSDLTNPDFVKLAESFGMPGSRTDNPSGLRAALEHAFTRQGPSLIEYQAGEFPDPWYLHFKK